MQNDDKNQKKFNTDRLVIYSRYFAKIPKYFNKAMKIVNNFGESVQIIFPKLEKPLFYIGLFFIFQEILQEDKLYNPDFKIKGLYLIDTLSWHFLASFLFPTLIIGNSVHYFVLVTQKWIKKKFLLQLICVSFSVVWISLLMNPIDNVTSLLLDQTIRKYMTHPLSNEI